MISGRIQYVLGYLFGECFNSKLRFDDGKIENGSESVVTEDNQGPFTPKGIMLKYFWIVLICVDRA